MSRFTVAQADFSTWGEKVEGPPVISARPITQPLEPAPNPLAKLRDTGTIEGNAKQELSAVLQGFKNRLSNDSRRFVNTTDSEYWCCFVFEDRGQKEAFLQAVGMKGKLKYVDGRELAERLSIALPAAVGIRYNDGTVKPGRRPGRKRKTT